MHEILMTSCHSSLLIRNLHSCKLCRHPRGACQIAGGIRNRGIAQSAEKTGGFQFGRLIGSRSGVSVR